MICFSKHWFEFNQYLKLLSNSISHVSQISQLSCWPDNNVHMTSFFLLHHILRLSIQPTPTCFSTFHPIMKEKDEERAWNTNSEPESTEFAWIRCLVGLDRRCRTRKQQPQSQKQLSVVVVVVDVACLHHLLHWYWFGRAARRMMDERSPPCECGVQTNQRRWRRLEWAMQRRDATQISKTTVKCLVWWQPRWKYFHSCRGGRGMKCDNQGSS